MIHHSIYFQDRKPETQQEVWEDVAQMLVEDGWLQQEEWETEQEFLERVFEAADDYISRHNLARDYQL